MGRSFGDLGKRQYRRRSHGRHPTCRPSADLVLHLYRVRLLLVLSLPTKRERERERLAQYTIGRGVLDAVMVVNALS